MLPALQMHPRPVPPHPNLDDFAGALPVRDRDRDRDHDRHHGDSSVHVSHSHSQLPRNAASAPYRRSFPIRISQPQLHQQAARPPAPPVPTFVPLPEHKLRRKTPNGTVDAGYDGSPVQPSPGPPPLKHMILPASAGSRPHVLTNAPFRRVWTAHQHSPQDVGGQSNVPVSPWLFNGALLPCHFRPLHLQPSDHLPAQPNTPNTNTETAQLGPNVYQPVIRANEYNVRAICPPPLPMNGPSFPFGQIAWQPGSSPWDCRNLDHPRTLSLSHGQPDAISNGRPVLYHLTGHSSPGCPRSPGNLHQATHFITAPPQPWNFDQATHAASIRRTTGRLGQPAFKEKALAHAHQSYVDLLAFLQASGRSNPLRTSSGSGSSYKLPAYPRPPQTGQGPSRGSRESGTTNTARFVSSDAPTGNRYPREPFMSAAADTQYISPSRHSALAGSDQLDFANHKQILAAAPLTNPPSVVRNSPVANAKTSLGFINNLCEQSDWKWLDGMLLGGCLYYGLERYEDALKWFSRILNIDSSHVEAITNMAATLYCLNRQGEAEQLWLRAVKLRPSYLEATEHLVGLLYKKRSKEAVEVISYVQRALMVPSQRADDQGRAGDKHYGSSGYALPGSENGRILALVHAKGTMLYGLKEAEKASEAFEEAVLISVGRCFNGIQDLIRRIQAVLSPGEPNSSVSASHEDTSIRPLMLPPERARRTAQLVFAGGVGELPGLFLVRNGSSNRAAVQTTSNSLLSLAKIFQDAMSSGSADSSLLHRSSSVGDILALYYLSLSLQESPSTANNVGILLAGIQQTAPFTAESSVADLSRPSIPGITPGSGMALALAYYNYGLRLDPKHVHLHTNLGSLLKDIGQLDLSIQMYERAVSCDGTFDIALTNLANAVKDKGRINDAITYYRRAVSANPGFAEAVCGLLTALNSVCNWRGRGGVMLESGRYDRWHVDEDGKLLDVRASGGGSGLTKRVIDIVAQQLRDASRWGQGSLQETVVCALAQQLQQFCEDSSLKLDDAIRQWAGKPWEGSRSLRLVERATRVILRRRYLDLYVSAGEFDSPNSRPRLPPSLTVPTAPTVLPFHTFTCPLTAGDIRIISQRNAMRISCSTLRSSWLPSTVYPPPPPPDPQLNVGYISSDFNNHPLAHLMQSVFGFHNPSRARAFCYATTASDRSTHRQQIEREAPVFRDVSSWPPDKLLEQIVRDHIHILVNLNGYTRGARNEVFAARPAPIQMSFMGFAGSLGAEWCDYILADTAAIPPSTLRPWRNNTSIEDVFRDKTEGWDGDWAYSENIIFCRDTFFCCDHAQSCDSDEKGMTWEEETRRRWSMRKQLFPTMGDEVVILGNFNQLYKIEPTTFRSWLRILARVPRAVLWLLRFPEAGESNLRATAEAWAGHEVASRLMFTDVAPKKQHISRARVCDLFLDTPECNAHTTAADVLWSSTPLLTLPRYPYKMCSRMAASILRGALPQSGEGRRVARELTAENEAEYEQTAVELADGLAYVQADETGRREGRGRLAEMRRLLWDSRWRCGLFDTRRWVEDVETAYEEAWRRWVEGVGGDIYL